MTTSAQENIVSAEEPVQYLTFTLDGDAFATKISQVREVLEFSSVTNVPRTPDYMRGVINMRGSVVPVVDLRIQFGMVETEPTVDTCIIIVEIQLDGQPTVLGALADSVQEVIELKRDQLEPAPRLGTRVNTEYIRAMGKHNDEFVIILDMNRVFSVDQIDEIQDGSQVGVDEVNEAVESAKLATDTA
ncbi:MAG: chemotaxis protein CheW [Gammaproteobacteria bacterium]|nr:chemotaxis protein CheW [Gammaproteobacteria bacterium]